MPANEASVYAGVEVRQFSDIVGGAGGVRGAGDPLPSTIRMLTMQGVVSYGLLDPLEVEASIPWVIASAARPDAPGCTDLGLAACRDTSALGVVQARLKLRLVDELRPAPLTASGGVELRLGQGGEDARARLTAVGEGQTDLGVFVIAGRSANVSELVGYSAHLQGGWRYRFPNIEVDGRASPEPEWHGEAEILVGVGPNFNFGPAVTFAYRSGLDLDEIDRGDVDRFTSLGVTVVSAGGKLLIQSDSLWTFVAGASATVYAVNNPTDGLAFSVGLHRQFL